MLLSCPAFIIQKYGNFHIANVHHLAQSILPADYSIHFHVQLLEHVRVDPLYRISSKSVKKYRTCR